MRKFLLFTLILSGLSISAQTWTDVQLAAANSTTADNETLSGEERDAIMYLNLARMYPKDFAKYELQDYTGSADSPMFYENSPYKTSLLDELNYAYPIPVAFILSDEMNENCKCVAKEQSEDGSHGDVRKFCPETIFVENRSYGMETGKDIVMQWLIDHDFPDLDHRNTLLNGGYTEIGLSMHWHLVYGMCAISQIK